MATVHISEAEAVQDFAGLLARVRAGEEVVIDGAGNTPVTLSQTPIRLLSESLKIARERGSTATLDDEFGRDLEAIIAESRSFVHSPWD